MAGGARKSPPQFPYLIDWSCSSSGSWVSLILEGVFGMEVALDGTVTANPQVSALDPDARLTGLRVGPTTYDRHRHRRPTGATQAAGCPDAVQPTV